MILLHWWESEGEVSHDSGGVFVELEHQTAEVGHIHLPGVLVLLYVPGAHELREIQVRYKVGISPRYTLSMLRSALAEDTGQSSSALLF